MVIEPLVFSSYNVWAPSWNMKLKEDWEENKMWSICFFFFKIDGQDDGQAYKQIQTAFARYKMPVLQAI